VVLRGDGCSSAQRSPLLKLVAVSISDQPGLWVIGVSRGKEKEVEIKSPIGNLNWSFLSLPFLWPFFRSVKDRYETSAESVKDGVTRLRKNVDIGSYTKPIRKRWKAWRD